jgi:hypothetical protein
MKNLTITTIPNDTFRYNLRHAETRAQVDIGVAYLSHWYGGVHLHSAAIVPTWYDYGFDSANQFNQVLEHIIVEFQ